MITVAVDAQTLVGFQGYFTKTKLATDSAELNRLQSMENSYGGGVSIKHFELGPVGFQAEINYEKSGFGFKCDTLSSIHYYQNLTYVSVAPLMQLDLGKHTFHIVGALGPYVNILIDAPEPETTKETVMMGGFSKMYTSDYNRFTYGLLGEGGVAFATKVGVFQFTGRAFIGMSKLMRFEGIALFNSTVPKSFGFGFHYFVPFGEEQYSTKKEKVDKDTLVSDLEILSDSLNAVSDTVKVKSSDKSSKKEKKVKEKKNKKSETVEPDVTEPEQPVSDETEQPVSEEPENNQPENNQSETSENKPDNDNNGTE